MPGSREGGDLMRLKNLYFPSSRLPGKIISNKKPRIAGLFYEINCITVFILLQQLLLSLQGSYASSFLQFLL